MSIIEVRGLKISFGALEVLRGIDLTVEAGERITIIGGSGCGNFPPVLGTSGDARRRANLYRRRRTHRPQRQYRFDSPQDGHGLATV